MKKENKSVIKYSAALAVLCLLIPILCGCGAKKAESESFLEHSVPAAYENLDNTKIGWGLKKEKGVSPQVPAKLTEVLKKYSAVYIDESGEKNMYLTFDEGYENGYSTKILDVLKATDTPAAFFITGDYIKTSPELVKRMHDEGFVVGNHTNHHPSMPDIDDNKIKDEIESLNKMYNELTGDNMSFFRPPKGEYSERTLAVTNELGYKTVLWSFAYADWEKNNVKGANYAYDSVTPYFHDGAILLLHAVSKDNADALESIINEAKNQGYTFKSLNDLKN